MQRAMSEDEAKTLKYQMMKVSEINIDNLNRLNCEWSDFQDKRLMDIAKQHLSSKHTEIYEDKDASLAISLNKMSLSNK